MSTFKLKSEKNKCLAQLQTLDGTHKMYESKFQTQRNSLPGKKEKLQVLQEEYSRLCNKPTDTYTTVDIKRKSTLKSKIDTLKKEIDDVENDVSELEYYSMTNELLIEYYDLVERYDEEHEDDLSENNSEECPKDENLYDMSDLDKLNKLKAKGNKKRKQKRVPRRRRPIQSKTTSDNIMGYFGIDTKSAQDDEYELEANRKNLYDNYLLLVDSDYASETKRRKFNKICTSCNVDKTLVQSEGYYVCEKCGEVEHVIIENERSSAHDPMPEKSGYPYKRINHLNEWPYKCTKILKRIIFIVKSL